MKLQILQETKPNQTLLEEDQTILNVNYITGSSECVKHTHSNYSNQGTCLRHGLMKTYQAMSSECKTNQLHEYPKRTWKINK